MRKLALLTILLSLAASPAIAGSYQDRAVATGVVIGASAGAVIGSQNGKTAEGAMIGGIMGAVAGAILANNTYVKPTPKVYRRTVYVRQPKQYNRHYGQPVSHVRQSQKYAHRLNRHRNHGHHKYGQQQRSSGHHRGHDS